MSQHFKFTRIKRSLGFRALTSIGMLAGVVAIAGCNLDSSVTPTGPQGVVQFVNAAPRYNSVDLSVDTLDLAPGTLYGNGTTVPVAAQATPHQFVVSISNDTTILASVPVLVTDQSVFTAILVQRPVGADLLVLPDTVTAPAGTLASVRVINASPSAGAVDVYVTTTDSTLVNPIATSLLLEGISPYVNVPVGSGRVRVTLAGTKTVLLDIDATSLTAGQVRTVVMIDSPGGGLPVTYLAIPDVG
jgi:hypothetical protein